MKAVRPKAGEITVVDLDEPPGAGDEVIRIAAASICSSDLMYMRFGLERVIGHELAGVRADGTGAVVEALYGCMECD
ncbi:alcohol dehydrogenase, partial [Parafrankia sp. BMG5.11]|uniref:alcohol dehydrogenase catalytic domain-containing protein n=1 Tax=Parafrankia sp. Ea1.12 TaxID=573499 RepID=UPI0010D72254